MMAAARGRDMDFGCVNACCAIGDGACYAGTTCRCCAGECACHHAALYLAVLLQSHSVRPDYLLEAVAGCLREMTDRDIAALPARGPRPRDLKGVWTWTPEYVVVGTCAADLHVIAREVGRG